MRARSMFRLMLLSMGWVWGLALCQPSLAHEPSLSILHSFDVQDPDSGVSPHGSSPDTRPILGWGGDIFGMTVSGGRYGTGVVYRYDPWSRAYEVIHTFGPLDAQGLNHGGAYPGVGLTRGGGDEFYGQTSFGGEQGTGTIFSVTARGDYKVLHTFGAVDASGFNAGGANPLRTLVLGYDGKLYGTTRLGGSAGLGVAFVIDHGHFTVLHQFSAAEGHAASLTQGHDGHLYGCAVFPQAKLGSGILYRMQTSGHGFEVLHTFQPVTASGTNADGADCFEPLAETRSGEFYGTAKFGGTGGSGVVFRYTAKAGVQVVHHFAGLDANGGNADGANPVARPTIGSDGALYATASFGGANGSGTIYRVTEKGDFKVIHTFSAVDATDFGNHDGAEPDFGVILDCRGDLIGVAYAGGRGSSALGQGNGTLYALSQPRD